MKIIRRFCTRPSLDEAHSRLGATSPAWPWRPAGPHERALSFTLAVSMAVTVTATVAATVAATKKSPVAETSASATTNEPATDDYLNRAALLAFAKLFCSKAAESDNQGKNIPTLTETEIKTLLNRLTQAQRQRLPDLKILYRREPSTIVGIFARGVRHILDCGTKSLRPAPAEIGATKTPVAAPFACGPQSSATEIPDWDIADIDESSDDPQSEEVTCSAPYRPEGVNCVPICPEDRPWYIGFSWSEALMLGLSSRGQKPSAAFLQQFCRKCPESARDYDVLLNRCSVCASEADRNSCCSPGYELTRNGCIATTDACVACDATVTSLEKINPASISQSPIFGHCDKKAAQVALEKAKTDLIRIYDARRSLCYRVTGTALPFDCLAFADDLYNLFMRAPSHGCSLRGSVELNEPRNYRVREQLYSPNIRLVLGELGK